MTRIVEGDLNGSGLEVGIAVATWNRSVTDRLLDAALARLEELADEDWVRDDTLERVRGMFNFRRERFRSRFDPETDGSLESRSLDYQRLLRELVIAERNAVFDLRRQQRIDDLVMRRVIRDLDLEEARLDG